MNHKISNEEIFHKKPAQSQQGNEIKSDNVWIDNIKPMFAVELQANSAVVCIVTLCFGHAEYSHSSQFTYHQRYYIITDLAESC